MRVSLVIGLLFLLILKFFVWDFAQVLTDSMNPTFHRGDYVLIDKFSYLFNKPKRGDIVFFKKKFKENQFFIQRIVAIEGDQIEVKNNIFYVNGKIVKKRKISLKEEKYYTMSLDKKKLPLGRYFLLGDYSTFSYDSRFFGDVGVERIIGKVLFVLF